MHLPCLVLIKLKVVRVLYAKTKLGTFWEMRQNFLFLKDHSWCRELVTSNYSSVATIAILMVAFWSGGGYGWHLEYFHGCGALDCSYLSVVSYKSVRAPQVRRWLSTGIHSTAVDLIIPASERKRDRKREDMKFTDNE